MRAILALALKDLRVMIRVKSGLFFTLVWPLVVSVFFGVIFSGSSGGSSRIAVSLIDEDRSPESTEFAGKLARLSTLEVTAAPRDEAVDSVRRGRRTAAILIPAGFGQASGRMFYGDPPRVEVWIDPSRKAEEGMLQGLLMKLGAERMQEVMANPAASRKAVQDGLKSLESVPHAAGSPEADRLGFLHSLDSFLESASRQPSSGTAGGSWEPISVESRSVERKRTGPRNPFDVTFPQGILWGIVGCTMAFAIGFVTERTQGTFVRLAMAPLSKSQLIAGKALACFISLMSVELLILLVGRLFFGVKPASVMLLAAAGLSSAAAFVGIMMMAASLGKTEQAAAGIGWAVMLPLSMLGGGMVPLFVMPPWMASASYFSPFRWAILAFEGAIWRGFTAQEMLLPCAVLLAIGTACFFAGSRLLRTNP